MVAFVDLFRRHALGVGPNGDGRPVGIGARYHEHSVPLESMEAGEHVGGQVRASDVAHMNVGIRIRPGYRDKNVFGHGSILREAEFYQENKTASRGWRCRVLQEN